MIRGLTETIYRRYGSHIGLERGPLSYLYRVYARYCLLNKPVPPFFNLEPTNLCNLRCSICPNPMSSRRKGFISLELVKKISSEVSRHGGHSYFLFKDGEPFLHKSLPAIIEIIKTAHRDNRVYISTNGQLLTKELADALMVLKVDNINFSVDNATEEGYEKIRHAPLATVEKNINDLIEAKRSRASRYPDIGIHYVSYENNLHEVAAFKKKWERKPVTLKFMYFNSWTGAFPQGATFNDRKRYPCFSLWMFPSVNWDGTVSICCVDWDQQEILGDLNRQSFEEIWSSDKIKRYRAYHLNGEYDKIPICGRCNAWASRPAFLTR
ncbi:MAG: radical SAM protein [Candidatus Omnitrophica bacterium]|nr:radical SAM protein [Candidatus Omnitrophota bacterium]